MSLLNVETFLISREALDATGDALRRAGMDGYELIVLWSGIRSDPTFTVMNVHAPRQYAMRADVGALAQVPGDELHRLNVWLLDHRQVIGAQVHSHPGEAYHSDTDNEFAIVTLLGGLSIVVPHFGRDGALGPGSAAFRLYADGWQAVDRPAGFVEVAP